MACLNIRQGKEKGVIEYAFSYDNLISSLIYSGNPRANLEKDRADRQPSSHKDFCPFQSPLQMLSST
jgi:hypothetical protein